jgi:Fe2+ transport system protein FeoA
MEKQISLIDAKEGREIEIVSVAVGLQAAKRLSDLGLIPNTKIKVLKKAILGPIEIGLRGSKLVLGRGLARKIFVR